MRKDRTDFKAEASRRVVAPERGSILFYLLISVVLLGALYYAVALMLRGGGNAPAGESATVQADGVLQYANTVRNAVQAMTVGGVDPASVCFDSPNWGATSYSFAACGTVANKVFDPAGGGVTWEANSADATSSSKWLFTGANGVAGVGSACAAASCADLKMVLPDLPKILCLAINTQLGIVNPGGNPPVDQGYDAAPFAGAFTASGTGDIGDEAGSADLAGQPAGCFLSTAGADAGHYAFYRVLVER